MEGQKYKIAIIGATGAIGKEMVRLISTNPKVEEVALLVRRKLPEWDEMELEIPEFKSKVKYVTMDSFDDLGDKLKADGGLQGYDAFICALGTRV